MQAGNPSETGTFENTKDPSVTKLVGGAALKGTDQAIGSLTGAAEGLKTAANVAPSVLASIMTGTQAMLRDPQYWLSFFSTVNDSAEQARADGADDVHAALYAMTNSLFNAGVEVGGGIQTLPKELRAGKTAALEWVRSMVDEGKEEVVQGVLERGLQNLIYQKENPAFSKTDPDAAFNPRTAAEEFTGGAVVGGLLGGGQVLAGRAMDAVAGRNLDVNARAAGAAAAERSGAADSMAGLEKTAPKERTEGIGGIKQPYDPIMAGVIRREGKTFRNLVAGWDTSVSDFFNKWRNGRTAQNEDKLEKLYLGQLTDSVRQQVSDILGYAVDNRHVIITNDDIKHIFNRHGNPEAEIKRGNLPLEAWVLEAIPEIVANPDTVSPGEITTSGKHPGKQSILFSRAFQNGQIVIIQFDNAGRGTMEITTMYVKRKSGNPIRALNMEKNSSQLTFKTPPGPVVSADNSIPRLGENGNRKKGTSTSMVNSAENAASTYDYFETPISIGDEDYIAKFDVEVIPDANNYRTHKIEKIDLTHSEAKYPGPAPGPSSDVSGPIEGTRPPDPDFTIPPGAKNVNPRGDGLGAANAGFTTRGMEGAEQTGQNIHDGYGADVAWYMRALDAANAAAQLAALEEAYQQNTVELAANVKQPPQSDSAARNAAAENAPLQREVNSGDMLIRQYAYDLAAAMLTKGEMPDAATLSAAGISAADAMGMMMAAIQKQRPAYRSGPSSPQAAAKPKDSENVIVSDGQLSRYAQTVLSNLRDSVSRNHGLTSAQKYTYDRQVQDGMLSERELEYILNQLGL